MSEKLAINGGPKVVPEGMIKPWPWIIEEDKKAVMEVFSKSLVQNDSFPVDEFQDEWARYVGTKHCLLTNSGTAALHMAVAAAEVGPGDEVIIPAYTFVASATSVIHNMGIPIFVDIDPKSYCIDPKKIEEKITEKTKAVMPVHIFGLPADMDEITTIARKYDLCVVEDACQAHGAEYKGKKAGSLGDMSCFSLNRSKNLMALEGGLFNTDSDEYKERAAKTRQFGEEIIPGKPRDYIAGGMGWMYRSNAMVAALARSQLRRLDEMNAVRIKNCEYLTTHLAKIDGVQLPYSPSDEKHVYYNYIIRFKPAELDIHIPSDRFRDAVAEALHAEGVSIWRWQPVPIPAQPLFQEKEGFGKGYPWSSVHARKGIEYRAEDYPETVEITNDAIFIRQGYQPPNGLDLMEYYVEAFRKVFANLDSVVKLAEK